MPSPPSRRSPEGRYHRHHDGRQRRRDNRFEQDPGDFSCQVPREVRQKASRPVDDEVDEREPRNREQVMRRAGQREAFFLHVGWEDHDADPRDRQQQ